MKMFLRKPLIIAIACLVILLIGAAAYISIPAIGSLANKSAGVTSGSTITDKPVPTGGISPAPIAEPTPALTPSPAPESTQTPEPTEPPVEFYVSAISVSVQPYQNPPDTVGNFTFTFTGTITATAAGTVHYHWGRSDGNNTTPSDEVLVFDAAGSKQITTTWITYPGDRPSSYMNTLFVTSPNAISNYASFTFIGSSAH